MWVDHCLRMRDDKQRQRFLPARGTGETRKKQKSRQDTFWARCIESGIAAGWELLLPASDRAYSDLDSLERTRVMLKRIRGRTI